MEIDLDRLATVLTAALRTVLDSDEFDVTPGGPGELDVGTDEWTLHIERWPDGVAWLAIDDEPDDPAHFTAARRAVMPIEVERVLAIANRELGGALSQALASSGDPFSEELHHALVRNRDGRKVEE